MISPLTPGSGYVLLHHVMGELEGIRGAWGYPEGGMGAVSMAIAKSAMAAGAELYADSPVAAVTTGPDGTASGIVLEDGTEVRSGLVLSNATPEVTFNRLLAGSGDVPTEYRRALAGIDYTSPVCKINIAVNKIPNFLADPNTTPDTVMPHHRATIHLNCEDSGMIEDAYKDAKERGTFSHRPMIEMTIPSSLDGTLAPPGHHVCLIFSQYAPYR
jgi:phytoene dehydrogenase-like protein